MSKTDNIFWRQFGIILGLLVLFGFVVAFIARSIAGDAFDQRVNSPSAVAERIAPVGSVRVGDPKQVVAAAPAPQSVAAANAGSQTDEGESVYSSMCQACHVAGVAGAPKVGDAVAWAPRIALGEDALVQSVVNGKNAMPPKGGNPALSEEQIRAAVVYMISKTPGGADQAADGAKTSGAAAQGSAAAVAGEAADKARQTAGEAADKAKQITSDATDKATVAAGAATAQPQATAAASTGKPGVEVYNGVCVACHVAGVANAPKLTDKAAWEPRAATGFAALVQSVLNGKGAMPPKGGAMALEQADIENAVRYMLEQAGVSAGD